MNQLSLFNTYYFYFYFKKVDWDCIVDSECRER